MDTLTSLFLVFVAVILSMTLHEAMHAYAGYWLGDDTAAKNGRLTLNPLAHIDPFSTVLLPLLLTLVHLPPFGAAKPVPFNPARVRYGDLGAALVGVAGPLTNFVLAFIGFSLFALFQDAGLFTAFLLVFVFVNLGFFIFNMIPLPPLDGSRVLYALAPRPVQRVMETIEQYGILSVFAVVILFNSQIAIFMQTAMNFFLHIFGAPFGLTVVL